MELTIRCPNCNWGVIPRSDWNAEPPRACPSCRRVAFVHVFPAIDRDAAPEPPRALESAEEAACYYHPAFRAAAECHSCGRFLCTLCDLPMIDSHLCPECLKRGAAARQVRDMDQRRWMPGATALALALTPFTLIGLGLSLFTAPAALFLVIRYWNGSKSAIPRSRWMHVIAGLLAFVQLAAWVALIVFGLSRGDAANQ